jgi:hypothetical protein
MRAQQVQAGLLGLCIGLVVVAVGHGAYFERGFVPPAAAVLASVVDLSQQAGGLAGITPWILAGALVQWLGGAGRQVGVLLATGLLIDNSAAGWAILAGLTARTLLGGALRGRADRSLAIFGLGCIAGDMLHTALGD